ncbi:hypothetical protein [Roseovarius sp. SYSU LYC5161]|uniref:hypothetical protein n=1 Tax=Roseovarius halophilus (ex Wu et al. 2025) TaxID=3376060 RepID=UPI00399B0C15
MTARPANAAGRRRTRSKMMTTLSLIQSKITGKPVVRREDDTTRLIGFYPNVEKGMRFFAAVVIVALLTIIVAPALYYGAPAAPPQSLGDLPVTIISGIPAALAPLVELARSWEPGDTLPDLQGWVFGLVLAVVLLMYGAIFAHIWRGITGRPYLAIKMQGDRLSIQRGQCGTPVTIPREECRAVHVGRRKAGTYEVLLQHGDALTQIAIVDGHERRALLLKAKIEAMLTDDEERRTS